MTIFESATRAKHRTGAHRLVKEPERYQGRREHPGQLRRRQSIRLFASSALAAVAFMLAGIGGISLFAINYDPAPGSGGGDKVYAQPESDYSDLLSEPEIVPPYTEENAQSTPEPATTTAAKARHARHKATTSRSSRKPSAVVPTTPAPTTSSAPPATPAPTVSTSPPPEENGEEPCEIFGPFCEEPGPTTPPSSPTPTPTTPPASPTPESSTTPTASPSSSPPAA